MLKPSGQYSSMGETGCLGQHSDGEVVISMRQWEGWVCGLVYYTVLAGPHAAHIFFLLLVISGWGLGLQRHSFRLRSEELVSFLASLLLLWAVLLLSASSFCTAWAMQ
jgi:hypothetical protein